MTDPGFFMKERLGAWQVGENSEEARVQFKLFFPSGFDPQIESIRVVGDFQHAITGGDNWDTATGGMMTRTERAEGTFWSYATPDPLKKGFYEYKYWVTFTGGETRWVSDPCTRYGGRGNENAGVVVGGSRPAENVVMPIVGGRKPQRDLVIYEMNIDDFTQEYREKRAPLDAVQDRLLGEFPHLVDLGINAILFMPPTAWANRDFDWGYTPFQYFAVEYRYANSLDEPEEKLSWLKKLISTCHANGIHVIIDGVFNHVSKNPPFPYRELYKNPNDCPFTGDFGEAFQGLQDLNFENDCTQEFIRDVCLYWMDTFGIDGIRFDAAKYFSRTSDTKGLGKLLDDIKAHLGPGEENFTLTLEFLDMQAASTTNNTQATSYWDNALYSHCFQYLWDHQIDSDILNALTNDRWLTSDAKAPTIYLSNHDHSHVTFRAGENDDPGGRQTPGGMHWYRTQPYAIALLTSPGTPMIQNGQEFGEDHWIPEDDQDTGRRVRPRPLRWKLRHDRIGNWLFRFYKRLVEIRNTYPALRQKHTFYPEPWETWQTRFNPAGFGVDTEKQVAIYHRWGFDNGAWQRFFIVLNFSASEQTVTVHFPENGPWTDLLSSDGERWGTWTPNVTDLRLELKVGPNWGHIFFR